MTERGLPSEIAGRVLVKRLGRAAFLVQDIGKMAVAKVEPPSGHRLSKLSRLLFGGSLPFRNELRLARFFSSYEARDLALPKLIATDDKSYLIYDYVDGTRPTTMDSCREQMIGATIEFAFSNAPNLPTRMQRLAFRALQAPAARVLQRSVAKRFQSLAGWRSVLKVWLVLLGASVQERAQKINYRVHNDLAPHNLLLRGEKCYWIDLEDSVVERKWLLVDVVDWSWSRETLKLNEGAIRLYVDRLHNKGLEFNVARQVRVALIRRALMWIANNEVSATREQNLLSFLLETLLEGPKYRLWFHIHISTPTLRNDMTDEPNP